MLTAITRAVSPGIARCELTYLQRQPIDYGRAVEQHRRYEDCLADLGAHVISLPAEPDLPDSMFVEDPAIVLDEIAVITRMKVESRRGEAASLARALEPYRPLAWLREPGTLEGGDVLRMGRRLFAGVSPRTNATGIAQLADVLRPFGYSVDAVPLRGCMHLKSGCSALGDRAILVNRRWIDAAAFDGFELVDVAENEPHAANVLRVGETVIMAACFPATCRLVASRGYRVRWLDISELQKAESGLTCSCLLFNSQPVSPPQLS
jgi:dimethylargininase